MPNGPLDWLAAGGRNPQQTNTGINLRDLLHPSVREASPNISRTPLYYGPANILEELSKELRPGLMGHATFPREADTEMGGLRDWLQNALTPGEDHVTLHPRAVAEADGQQREYWRPEHDPGSNLLGIANMYAGDPVYGGYGVNKEYTGYSPSTIAAHELAHVIYDKSLSPEMRQNFIRIVEGMKNPHTGRSPQGLGPGTSQRFAKLLGYPEDVADTELFARLFANMGHWPDPGKEKDRYDVWRNAIEYPEWRGASASSAFRSMPPFDERYRQDFSPYHKLSYHYSDEEWDAMTPTEHQEAMRRVGSLEPREDPSLGLTSATNLEHMWPYTVREGNPLWEFMRTAAGEDPRELYLRLREQMDQMPKPEYEESPMSRLIDNPAGFLDGMNSMLNRWRQVGNTLFTHPPTAQ